MNLHYVTIHVSAKVLWCVLNYRIEEDMEVKPHTILVYQIVPACGELSTTKVCLSICV